MVTNNATTGTTALVKWDAETQTLVEQLIHAGKSVPKSLVLVAPKGFVSGIRKDRRAYIMQNSDRMLGEFAQNGFRLADTKSKVVSKSTGDESVWVKFVKQSDPVTRIMKEYGVNLTGKALEQFRELLGKGMVSPVVNA